MAGERVAEHSGRWSAEVERRWGYLAEDLRRRLGPGTTLDAAARATFEGRLGGDLSATMVHRSPLAGHLARSLDAHALSTGDHVLGDDAALDQSTAGGMALLGHELAHVVQRATDTEDEDAHELQAQVVERTIAGEVEAPGPGPLAGIDADALAERVYQRLWDQLRHERDRAAWVG